MRAGEEQGPLLAPAAERDSPACPVVWTSSFRSCSQMVFEAFPHGCGLRQGASRAGAAAVVHGLQQTALG